MATTYAANTQKSGAPLACQPAGTVAGVLTASPVSGRRRWPRTPITASARHERSVNPTTQALRRLRPSDNAPSTGIESNTSAEAIALAVASIVLETPRSVTSHTAKYNVAMFMEKMVLAKSYNAQLHRSTRGARSIARISPSGRITGKTCSGCAIRAPSECVHTATLTLVSHGGRRDTSRDVASRCAVDGRVSQSKLRDMKLFRATWLALGLVSPIACERAKTPPPVETATATPVSP